VGIGGSAYTGYNWSTPYAKRWGKNVVVGTQTVTYANSNISTSTFYTQFSAFNSAAQATSGDSGGGVFTSNGTLAGIMIAVGNLSGQPDNTSVYGETTYTANIATYRSQILGAISATPVPEPATMALVLLSGAVLFFRNRPPHRGGPTNSR
jgi:hypothetical protein